MNVLISYSTTRYLLSCTFWFYIIGATFKCYYTLMDETTAISDCPCMIYFKHSWHNTSFLINYVCVLTSEGLQHQRNHVREIVTEVDHTCITSLQATGHTKDEYVSWLMYVGMISGILLNLASFSTYPFYVSTRTHLFWLWSLCLRSPSTFETVVMFEITRYVGDNPVNKITKCNNFSLMSSLRKVIHVVGLLEEKKKRKPHSAFSGLEPTTLQFAVQHFNH